MSLGFHINTDSEHSHHVADHVAPETFSSAAELETPNANDEQCQKSRNADNYRLLRKHLGNELSNFAIPDKNKTNH